ncbi:MAG TPA: CHRD domain-containing protein [Candidatus Peribacteraceae bacterium]|nr:CHRD domain-containing protein [Candidatus Peribacteraceae bacterium]
MSLAQRIAGIAGVAALISGAAATSAFADSYSTQSVTQYSTQNGYSTHTTVQTPQGTNSYGYSIPPDQLNLNVGATFPPVLPPVNVGVPLTPNPLPVDLNIGSSFPQSSQSESSMPQISSSSSEPISSESSSFSSVSSAAPVQDNTGLIDQLEQEVQSLQQRVAQLEAQLSELQTAGSPATESGMTTVQYQAMLSPDQQVPPVNSSGSGIGTFTLNGNNLTYHITVQNLTSPITAAHFHVGASGQNGSAIQPITFSGSTADGTWNNLTQDQINDLNTGLIYVNVHTSDYPDGEIRGQVLRP